MFIRIVSLLFAPALSTGYDVSVPGLGSMKGGDGFLGYNGVAQFGGIPFAKPPLDARRWQPPQAYGAWSGLLDATKFGSRCAQQVSPGDSANYSEDCLFLNVATPATMVGASKSLPVMFWIHGGAYVGGSGDYPLDALVSASNFSVVVVSTNYRLGYYGFLASKDIQARTTDGTAGNFGIQDQRMALMWVRDHITPFGGNGGDVTIFGESAGGNSVMNHVAQAASFPFYKKAIIESGTWMDGAIDMDAASVFYATLLNKTSCTDLPCMLALSSVDLQKAVNGIDYLHQIGLAPAIDGISLTATPKELIIQQKHNKAAPVIIGSNREEMASAWFNYYPHDMNETVFDYIYSQQLGSEDLAKVKKLYDPSSYDYPANLGNYSIWWWTAARMLTDMIPGAQPAAANPCCFGACAARSLARSLLDSGSSEVYTYLFAKPPQSPNPEYGPSTGPGNVIVAHAMEIPFVYGHVKQLVPADEKELASSMAAYWSSFARAGNPNQPGLPQWPSFSTTEDTILRFDNPLSAGGIHTQKNLRKDACDFWDSRLKPHSLQVVV